MKIIIKLIICMLSFNSLAQIAPLENHIWYLEKLVINGNDVFPPQNLQPNNDFNYNQTYNFLLKSCWDINGELTYNDANYEFSIIDSVLTPNECPSVPNADLFDTTYISEFYDFNNGHPNPFSYAFTTQPNYIVLTITNGNGDQAIYRNEQLAVANKEKVAVHLYPNPVTNNFQLEVESGKNIKSLRIFSVNGKEVLGFKEAQSTYDVSQLPAGIYFVKIKSETGESVKKMLKQ
ncbi:T9SS type A sorting domain-containing protein [Mesonia ostreae]|uniref:T9SS type A sorting domain-containing protein n=1 Tax=Mesonia ostreae TaxID=861110 RepID=A0ABU2KMR6_9FLAO|nr:T9SS type A sorting domain-containing protein [Mesonia ostreae]MDT0295914.1 T9SS type A sorting domain-containing protein [Mesonia ostreae]